VEGVINPAIVIASTFSAWLFLRILAGERERRMQEVEYRRAVKAAQAAQPTK
jgi:hypothetical protein